MENELPVKKPSFPQRVAASRANGQMSQGPKTPDGRLQCSNAAKSQFKHNMLAETVLLTGESRQRFVQLKPLSEPEHDVIQKVVVAHWRQIRGWSTLQSNFNCEIAHQDEKLPNVLRASSAELAMNPQGNSLALTKPDSIANSKSAMRDLEFLRKLRGSTTGLAEIPVPGAASTWEHPDDQEYRDFAAGS